MCGWCILEKRKIERVPFSFVLCKLWWLKNRNFLWNDSKKDKNTEIWWCADDQETKGQFRFDMFTCQMEYLISIYNDINRLIEPVDQIVNSATIKVWSCSKYVFIKKRSRLVGPEAPETAPPTVSLHLVNYGTDQGIILLLLWH